MGRTGRKGKRGTMGSLEGEQVMHETSETPIFPATSFGTQGSSYRLTAVGQGNALSPRHGECRVRGSVTVSP